MATPSPEELDAFHRIHNGPRGSRVTLVLAVEIPIVILVVSTVCLRFYARTFIKRTLGKDDWIMALSALIAFINTVINCVTTKYGQGVHAWNLDYKNITMGAKLGWVYQVLFPPAVTLCKVSIVITYLRIFPSRKDRIFCFTILVYLTASGIIVTFIIGFQCVPVNAYWDLSIKEKRCYNQKAAMMIVSALNSVSDLTVFLWPAPKIMNIQLPVKQRLGLVCVFSLGCIVCIAGIIKIIYYPKYFRSKDVFWEAAVLSLISNIECNAGIICGSLPEIRPLLMRFVNRSTTSPPASHHPSRSDRLPGSAGSYTYNQYQSEISKHEQAVSRDSLGKISQWKSGKDFGQQEKQLILLQEFPPGKAIARHEQRASGSEADGSHGSEEMWITGGEIDVFKKNTPGTAL